MLNVKLVVLFANSPAFSNALAGASNKYLAKQLDIASTLTLVRDLATNYPSKIPPHFVATVVASLLPPRSAWPSFTTDQLLKLRKRQRELTELVTNDPVRYFRPTVGGQYDFLTFNDPEIQGLYFFAGNKSGKTTGAAVLVSENAASEPLWGRDTRSTRDLLFNGRSPLRLCAFCEDFSTHNEVIVPSILSWTPRRYLAPKPIEFGPQGNVVSMRYANGSILYFRTYDQGYAKAEGKDYDIVWCDEPPDRSVYTAIWRGLVATRGKCIIAATLLSEAWLYDELEKPFVKVFEGSMRDNQWLDRQGVENYIALLTAEERTIRIDGKPSQLSGKIYPSFRDAPPFVIPEAVRIWDPREQEPYPVIMGVDPHERKPLHIAWAWLTPEDRIVWFDWALIPSHRRLSEVFYDIARYEERHTSPSCLVIMDPNRGGASQIDEKSWQSAFEDEGYEVLLGIDDIEFGHMQLREMLATTEPQMQWMETCRGEAGPIYQMGHYLWDNYTPKVAFQRGQKEKPKQLNKDFPDIMRYVACAHLEYAVLQGGKGYSTISLKQAKANARANAYLR